MEQYLDQFWTFAVESFGPLGPFYLFAGMGALLVLLAVPLILRKDADPIERLQRLERSETTKLKISSKGPLRRDQEKGNFEALAPYLEPSDEGELSAVRAKLIHAGYRDRGAVRVFYLARAGLAIGLVVFGLIVFGLAQKDPDPALIMIFCGIGGIFGYLGPSWWITRRRQQRQQEMADGFPDALDLMLVCVEAGQSLDQAITRVSGEINDAHEVLSEELQVVANEMRAGRDRPTVLRDFADRSGVQDISSFVTVLVQSASFGTSVSQALRVYASEMRDKRLMRAEEKANTLPTKLTLGTMFFTVPPLLLILIGPSLIQMLRALSSMNSR